MVTSGGRGGRNFGAGEHPDRAVRYAGAHEVIARVQALWPRPARRARPRAGRC